MTEPGYSPEFTATCEGLTAGGVVICPECGHSSDSHGIEGCEARRWSCPCPFQPSDIVPMTQEQRAEFDRNRRRQP